MLYRRFLKVAEAMAAIAMEAMAAEANNGGFDGEALTMDAMSMNAEAIEGTMLAIDGGNGPGYAIGGNGPSYAIGPGHATMYGQGDPRPSDDIRP